MDTLEYGEEPLPALLLFFLFSNSGEMLMEGYITIKELAEKWDLTVRRVQILCAEGRIPGVQKF